MNNIKKFVSVVGLHKVFKSYNDSSGSIEGYLPNLLDPIPVKENGDTFDSDSILFIIADYEDVGRYVFTGIKAVEDGNKYTYGGDPAKTYVHDRDTFIWAQGALIAGSDCGFQSFSEGVGDSWINTEVTTSEAGDVTINVIHKPTVYGIAGLHEAGTLDEEISGNTVPIITSITIDSTGHVTGVTTGKSTDTTYQLLNYSETDRQGNTTVYEDRVQLVPTINGVQQDPLAPVTVDEVEHLRYSSISGDKVSVGVTNVNSSASNLIMTAAAVLAAITAKVEEGVSFRGVDSLSKVLMQTSSANGEMWKINAVDVEFSQYKDRIQPALTDEDSQSLKIGDVLVAVSKISNGTPKWYVIPSGDDIEDSWRAVQINGEDFLTNLIAKPATDANANDGMAINLKSGNMITITVDPNRANGNITFNHAQPWAQKPSTAAEAGRYISGITIDSFGHITGITTASISESIKDNIKQVDFTVATDLSDENPIEIGITSTKNDGTSVVGSPIRIEGQDGISAKTDATGKVILQGTSYSLNPNVTTTDIDAEGETGTELSIQMSSTGNTVSSSTAKVKIETNDPVINIHAGTGIVNIDYTGASSEKDWAVLETDTLPKKFGKIIGIHNIFNSVASIENSVFNGDVVDQELNENSIIYFIADAIDVAKTEFANIRLKSGWGYIWAKGKLYNADLINMSQLYDDLIKTIQPTDAVFPSEFLTDKNWQELPEDCYKNALSGTGTYVVQLTYKQVIYSGVFPYKEVQYMQNRDPYTSDLISEILVNTDDEIPLTLCGYTPDSERLYLKIRKGGRDIENGMSKPSLFIASSTGAGLVPSLFELKFKKLL